MSKKEKPLKLFEWVKERKKNKQFVHRPVLSTTHRKAVKCESKRTTATSSKS